MCTWLVMETVEYFLRKGGEVFACSMDMSKAFDTVIHSKLWGKLLASNMPAIVIRLLLVMYTTQYANVRWDGELSHIFSLKNGVKHTVSMSMACSRSCATTGLAAGLATTTWGLLGIAMTTS